MIKQLEKAGLGYHIEADQTVDKFGRLPMRHLVYRVQPLPQSLLPMVWDFGQLSAEVESLYIRQIVKRYMRGLPVEADEMESWIEAITRALAASQAFMREQTDECSFVSLRDAERVMDVMIWFSQQDVLFNLMDEHGDMLNDDANDEMSLMDMEQNEDEYQVLGNVPFITYCCTSAEKKWF